MKVRNIQGGGYSVAKAIQSQLMNSGGYHTLTKIIAAQERGDYSSFSAGGREGDEVSRE